MPQPFRWFRSAAPAWRSTLNSSRPSRKYPVRTLVIGPKGTLEALFSGDVQAKLNTIVALHHGLGLRAEPLSADDARELEPALSSELEAAVLRPDEACVDNRALTRAVAIAAAQAGVKFFAGRHVQAIRQDAGRCTGLIVDDEKIEARWTVIAAGCYSAEIEGAANYAPVRPAKGQMIALRAKNVKHRTRAVVRARLSGAQK